jgi:hypothetical protein
MHFNIYFKDGKEEGIYWNSTNEHVARCIYRCAPDFQVSLHIMLSKPWRYASLLCETSEEFVWHCLLFLLKLVSSDCKKGRSQQSAPNIVQVSVNNVLDAQLDVWESR